MDIKDLIKKADAYGKESQAQQQQIEEGLWDDFVAGAADLAKKLGIPPETADKVANAISTQPEAEQEVNAVDPAAGGTAASGSGVSPDAAGETQDLMTRYNAGGKKAMPEIEKLQQDLKDLGFDPNGVDGKYGNGTFKAVQEFQKANGLQADGQAGKDTLAKIEQVKSGGGDNTSGSPTPTDVQDRTRGSDTAAPDAETQAIIDELNALLQQMGQPAGPATGGGDPEVISTSVDFSGYTSIQEAMRRTMNLYSLYEATQEQIAKVDELLAKLQGTQWAKDNADALQQYVDRVGRAKNANAGTDGPGDTTPNATTAAAAGRADAADAGAAKAGVDGPADATAAAVQGGDAAATSTPNASTAAAAGRADAADAGGATDAEKAAGAGQAQAAAPKVGKEVYVQMGSNGPSTANFNVAQMKKKYPKPYVDIPAEDGTVTRGYGAPETLQAYVKKNPQAKIVGAAGDAGGQTVVTSRQFDQDAIQEAASMNVSADNAAELAELLGILRNAGMPDAAPVADMHVDMPMAHDAMHTDIDSHKQGPMPCATCGADHEPGPCGGGEDWDNSPDEGYSDMMDIIKLSGGPNSNKNPGDIRVKDPRQNDEAVDEDGWDNSPEEEYKDDDYMYQSGGIHKKKKAYAKAQDGDNAMAVENSIKAQLYKALEEKFQNK